MKNNCIFNKTGLRSGLFALIFIFPFLACNGSPVIPPVSKSTDKNPNLSRTISISKINPEKVLSAPFPSVTPQAKNFSQKSLVTITATNASAKPDSSQKGMSSADIVWEMIGKVSLDRALNDLKQLSGDLPICTKNGCFTIKNRLTGSVGLKWAKDYVFQELSGQGYSVKLQNWTYQQWSDQNIIARKPGTAHPEEEILFVAHLDGVGTDEQSRYPAADDNASGVVDILELARILHDYSLNRTVVLLITTGEEQGTLGVQGYINQLSQDEVNAIKYVVDIDMIGYDANQDQVMELWHGGHYPSIDFVSEISIIIKKYQINLVPRFIEGCG